MEVEATNSNAVTAFEFVDCNEGDTATVSLPKDAGSISYSSIFKITKKGTAKYGLCQLCSKRFKYSNKTSFKHHLKSSHPEIFKQKFKKTKPPESQNQSNSEKEDTYDAYLVTKQDARGNKFGKCGLCLNRLNIQNRNATAVIMRHLNVKHPIEYKKCLELTKEEETSKTSTKQLSRSSCKEATHFNILIVNRIKYGECRLCKKIVKMKYGNTTGLKRHLLAKHKKEHKALSGQVPSDDETNIKQEEVTIKNEELQEVPEASPNDVNIPIKTEELSVDEPQEVALNAVNIKTEPVEVKTEVVDEDFDPYNIQVKTEESNETEEMDYSTTDASPPQMKSNKQGYDTYYIIMPFNEDKMAICRLCCRDIKMKNSNTSGLKRHLHAKHLEQFLELFQGKPQRICSNASSSSDTNNDLDQHFFSLPSTSAAPQIFEDVTSVKLEPGSRTIYSQHYTIITALDNVKCGVCRLCSKCVKMTAGNTTGLKRHLKSKHPQQYFETFHPENMPPESRLLDVLQQEQHAKVQSNAAAKVDGDSKKRTTRKIRHEPINYERQFSTYFSFSPNKPTGKIAECRLCMEPISVDKHSKPLIDHLMLVHPVQHNELFPVQNQREEEKNDDLTSTYVVAIYSGSESEGEVENETVLTLSLQLQKKYSCYYTMLDEKGVKFGICRLCTKMIKMTKSNTSGLRRHLKSRHPEEYFKAIGEL